LHVLQLDSFQPQNNFPVPRSLPLPSCSTHQLTTREVKAPWCCGKWTDDMTSGPMRKLSTPSASFLRWKTFILHTHRLLVAPTLRQRPQSRSLAQVRPEPFSELWFTPSSPWRGPADELLSPSPGLAGNGSDHKPPDERILKLGKSTRVTRLSDICTTS
jgi:hypothetical protein